MVSVEDTNLRGGGNVLKQKIWDEAKTMYGTQIKIAQPLSMATCPLTFTISPHIASKNGLAKS
jgi:hypothetical protein